MSSASIDTLVKMMESVPEPMQSQVVERIGEYLEELREELRWDEKFAQTQGKLATMARQARKDIASGLAKPLEPEQL